MSPPRRASLWGMTNAKHVMERHVEAGVPGLAWAIARGGDVEVGWSGSADLAHTRPVQRDTIFRIASMTKPIVAVAALTFVEDCTLRLDDPVDDLLPELANRQVLADPFSPSDATVPAVRPVTLRDLLTFRLGLGMDFARWGNQPHMDRMSAVGIGIGPPSPQEQPGSDAFMAAIASLPLEFQPGQRWLYHTSADVLGVLLERAAGTSLETVLRDRVFAPLGMAETSFAVPAASIDRFTDCVAGASVFDPIDGQWARTPGFQSGGGGLVSTIDDYLAFATMLASGGDPLLARPTVELLATDHLDDAQRTTSAPEPDGAAGWGFCVAVRVRRTDHTNVGTYGWNGGLGSSWTNDPVAGITTILLTNQMFTSAYPSPAVHRDLVTCAYVGSS
jgi:CubicO group peptidase (beta-lactamase class C family)